ncbi:MAG: hypothetical protein BGO49_08420 [Planctomycetales bacterium 71-10]|nr:MAG: hypothetical protein BGO49_08420 [Planctomycetales bacterium 71-10]
MRKLANLALAAALGLGLAGCGGSPEVGDAEVVPATPPPAEKPAETPADKVAPDVQAGDPPKTAPEPEAAKAP